MQDIKEMFLLQNSGTQKDKHLHEVHRHSLELFSNK